MKTLEEKFSLKKKSDVKKKILTSILESLFSVGRTDLLLNSKLDRMRYYLNLKPYSINFLKEHFLTILIKKNN